MDDNRTTLAAEIAAELELTLPSAARALAGKLRQSEHLRRSLRELGLVRRLAPPNHDTTELDITGISAAATTLPAFGGLLYGTTVHAHRLRLAQRAILDASEEVRVHVGDLDFYESGQRLRWKLGQHMFELVADLLAESAPSRLILLDLPIFVSRGEEGNPELIEEVQEEWLEMVDTVNSFWRAHLERIYPLRSDGVILASLQAQNALPLFIALNNNASTSPDPLPLDLPTFVRAEWTHLRQAGMARLVDALLPACSRTIAYSFEDLHLDPRWQPSELHHSGILGFFMRANDQSPVWQVQVAGHHTQWTSEALDQIAITLSQVTLASGKQAEPLPLWYARRMAMFPRPMLAVFRDLADEAIRGGNADTLA